MVPGLRMPRVAILVLFWVPLCDVSAFSLSPLKKNQIRKRQKSVQLALGNPTTGCHDGKNLPHTGEPHLQAPTSQREETPEEILLGSLWESKPFEVAKNLVQSIVMAQEDDEQGPTRLTIAQDDDSLSASPLPPKYQNLFRRAFDNRASDQCTDDDKSLLETAATLNPQQLQQKERKGPTRACQSFSLEIAYMGEAFCGWQTQPNNHDRPSVQQTLEDWLQPMFFASRRANKKHQRYNEAHAHEDAAPAPRANLRVAGRTDAGVHAIGQVARFRTWTKRSDGVDAYMEWDKFSTGLSNNTTMHPSDDSGSSSAEGSFLRTEQQPEQPQKLLLDYINQHPLAFQTFRCLSVTPVSSKFHPTFGASARAYLYLIDADSIQAILQRQRQEVRQDPKMPSLASVKDLVQRLNELLEPLAEIQLDYLALSYGKVKTQSTECRLFVARAICVHYQPDFTDDNNNNKHSTMAVCIQLVGNRFLRRMVRILVATALREALTTSSLETECNETVKAKGSLATSNQNANTAASPRSASDNDPDGKNNQNSPLQENSRSCRSELVNILQSKDRSRAARPAPPQGLIFAAALFDDDFCDDDNHSIKD